MKNNNWPVTPAGKGFQVMLPTGADQALEAHYVEPGVTTCSCHRGTRCPALHEVRSYRSAETSASSVEPRSRRSLAAGGTRVVEAVTGEKGNGPDSQLPASCPICGAAVVRDRFGKRPGWRCERGGLAHYYWATYGHLKTWLTRPAGERLITLATPQELAAMALTYPAGA